MNIEALLWGLLPTVVSLFAVLLSLFVAFKARRVFHYVASGVVLTSVAWSLLILYRIFVQDAWPTYVPHLAIGVTLIIGIAQTYVFRRSTHHVA